MDIDSQMRFEIRLVSEQTCLNFFVIVVVLSSQQDSNRKYLQGIFWGGKYSKVQIQFNTDSFITWHKLKYQELDPSKKGESFA